jgi:hypothetical protein
MLDTASLDTVYIHVLCVCTCAHACIYTHTHTRSHKELLICVAWLLGICHEERQRCSNPMENLEIVTFKVNPSTVKIATTRFCWNVGKPPAFFTLDIQSLKSLIKPNPWVQELDMLLTVVCKVEGACSSDYEEFCFLGYDTVICWKSTNILKILLPLSHWFLSWSILNLEDRGGMFHEFIFSGLPDVMSQKVELLSVICMY